MNCPICQKPDLPVKQIKRENIEQLEWFRTHGRELCAIGMWSHVAGRDGDWMVYHSTVVSKPDNFKWSY